MSKKGKGASNSKRAEKEKEAAEERRLLALQEAWEEKWIYDEAKELRRGSGFFFESQVKLQCGLHALNNLLQRRAFTATQLREKCLQMRSQTIESNKKLRKRVAPDAVPERAVVPITCPANGNYESDVLIAVLTARGFDVRYCYNYSKIREYMLEKSGNGLRGFIFNLSGRHWTAMCSNLLHGHNLYLDSLDNHDDFVVTTNAQALQMIRELEQFDLTGTIAVFRPEAIDLTAEDEEDSDVVEVVSARARK